MIEPRILRELKRIVGEENVLTSPEDLIAYSYDATFLEHKPDAVVLPGSTEEVSEVMKVAYREGLPVIPRGMGSGLAGGSIPFSGGIVLALTRMNRILEIDEENMTAWVEAGVITAEFQSEVEKRGLFYPPDPSSHKYSTIGGNVACNAGGPRCLKYGVTGDYVLGMRVVLADGRILRTGGKVIKNATGYNLSRFFIGTEGTLGVITEVLLKLIAKPRYIATAFAVFPKIEDAGRAVHRILLSGIIPASIELMDQTTIGTVEEYLHLGLPTWAEAILVLEADGNQEEAVLREIEAIAGICRENGAVEVKVAKSETERNNLWKARRSVSPSLARRAPNKLGEDITVPRSQVPEAVKRIREISQKFGLPVAVFGHAGDGNLHPNILFDKRKPEDMEKVEKIAGEIFKIAVELGGVLSGEHGVGVLKQPYLEMALGPVAVEVMKAIKKALDPKGILNPGKVIPLGVPWRGE